MKLFAEFQNIPLSEIENSENELLIVEIEAIKDAVLEYNIAPAKVYWKIGEEIMDNGKDCLRNIQNPKVSNAYTPMAYTYNSTTVNRKIKVTLLVNFQLIWKFLKSTEDEDFKIKTCYHVL